MLVIMENRDIQLFFQSRLYLKTFRRSDILQVNAAEAGSDIFYRLDNFFRILGIQTDRERVHAAELLKQDRFSFHYRHRRLRADISKAKNRGSVRNNGYHVSFIGVCINIRLVLMDLPARLRDSRRVRRTQIIPGFHRDFTNNLDLPPMLCMEL